MTEEFAPYEIRILIGTVEHDKGMFGSWTDLMDRSRDHTFPRTGRPREGDGDLTPRQFFDEPEQLFHGSGSPPKTGELDGSVS